MYQNNFNIEKNIAMLKMSKIEWLSYNNEE